MKKKVRKPKSIILGMTKKDNTYLRWSIENIKLKNAKKLHARLTKAIAYLEQEQK